MCTPKSLSMMLCLAAAIAPICAAAYVPPAPPADAPLAVVVAHLNSSGDTVIDLSSSTTGVAGSYSGHDTSITGFVNGGAGPSVGGSLAIGNGYYVGGNVTSRYVLALLVAPRAGADASVPDGTLVPVDLSYATGTTHSGTRGAWETYSYWLKAPGLALISGEGTFSDGVAASDVVTAHAEYGVWNRLEMFSLASVTSNQWNQPQSDTFALSASVALASSWLAAHPDDTIYLATVAVPEPASAMLWIAGMLGLVGAGSIRSRARGSRAD